MPRTPPNAAGIELEYDVAGDPAGVPVLLVMGLGGQLIAWDDGFVDLLVERGAHVVRFDNRDVGLSTKTRSDLDIGASFLRALGGEQVEAPYLLDDMAIDAVGLLDHLGIDSAHVVGVSMGGMIAQAMAIAHPDRVRSLTSIMSTTGDRDVGQPSPTVAPILLQPPATDRDGAVAQSIASFRAIGTKDGFDEERARQRAERSYDRCYHPRGVGLQLVAIVSSPSRTERLRQLDVPALVVHGDADPLVDPSGGVRTAEAIPGARLELIPGMGHDLPERHWPQLVGAIWDVVEQGEAARASRA